MARERGEMARNPLDPEVEPNEESGDQPSRVLHRMIRMGVHEDEDMWKSSFLTDLPFIAGCVALLAFVALV